MKIKKNSIIKNLLAASAFAALSILIAGNPFKHASAAGARENHINFSSLSRAAPQIPTVIAAGLNNPRGLNFGADGALYVTEAGSGGAGPCAPGPEGVRCYGTTG